MSDVWRTCKECGERFFLSYDHQRWFRERGLEQPERCEACRAKRRRENDPGMRSEASPLYEFPIPDDQPPTAPPVTPPAPARRPTYPQQPRSWWLQPGTFSTLVFLWAVVVLAAFRLLGWPAGILVIALGVGAYLAARRQL